MNVEYIAGLFDGDGSVHASCFTIRNIECYEFKVQFTQCSTEILMLLQSEFGGKKYEDNRSEKYNNENAVNIVWSGKYAIPLLKVMQCHAIIKSPQAKIMLNVLENHYKKHDEDSQLARKKAFIDIKQFNKDKSLYDKDYSRISNAYIAGLFDAEGNVYISSNESKKLKYYVKITQKSDPQLIAKIRDFLMYGNVYPSESFRIRFESRKDIFDFAERVLPFCVVKKQKLQELIIRLNNK